jgi:acyl carrier protein
MADTSQFNSFQGRFMSNTAAQGAIAASPGEAELASEIDPVAPLYREGLGLDSIDILELSLAISKTYGVKLRSDDENNKTIFSSLRSLNTHIQAHRPR